MSAMAALVAAAGDGCAPKTSTEGSSDRLGALPCEVNTILENVCQRCHSSPPKNEAPFPLVTYVDTQVVVNGRPIASYMLAALEIGRMPMPPVQLDPADRETLVRWLRDGAPPKPSGLRCEASDGSAPAHDASSDREAPRPRDAGVDVEPDVETSIDAGVDADVDASDDGGIQ